MKETKFKQRQRWNKYNGKSKFNTKEWIDNIWNTYLTMEE